MPTNFTVVPVEARADGAGDEAAERTEEPESPESVDQTSPTPGARCISPCWPDSVSPGGAVPTSLHGLTGASRLEHRKLLGLATLTGLGRSCRATGASSGQAFFCSRMAQCGQPINPTGIPDLPPLTLDQPNFPWDLRGRTEAREMETPGKTALSSIMWRWKERATSRGRTWHFLRKRWTATPWCHHC